MPLSMSYVHGASSTPLIGETIGVCFDRAVERWPGREALIVCHQGIRWSYRELGRRVDAPAAGLLARGLEPGKRFGMWSMNDAERVFTRLATAQAGLMLVNVSPAYRPIEARYALSTAGCATLITGVAFETGDCLAMLCELAAELGSAVPGELRAAAVADTTFGEELCACIKLREAETVTGSEVRDFCRGRMAHFKIPRCASFVDSFPKTVTGKVQKFALREQTVEELGLNEEATV